MPTDHTAFYQPLNRDIVLRPADWQRLFKQAHQQGLSALVVQWTRYGEQDFMAADRQLQQVFQLALQYNIRIWVGLAADPDYFRQMEQPFEQRQHYLQRQLEINLEQLNRLHFLLGEYQPIFAGWYLPFEIHDNDLNNIEQATWLRQQLKTFAVSAGDTVAVSTFSNGNLQPESFARQLQLLADDGLTVWFQDGSGAALLGGEGRNTLLQQLDCRIGVIIEAFRQPQYGESFSARPASGKELSNATNAIRSCHPKLYFSLRYLPYSSGMLPLKD